MVDATGVSGNVNADYQTLQSMYSSDKNNISDDKNAMNYAKAFEEEAKQQGFDAEADKAGAAETGQKDVDFHGGQAADANTHIDKGISDAADKLRKAGNSKGADDLEAAEKNNDQHEVRNILDQNAGSDGFSKDDKSAAMQDVDLKDLQNDMQKHHGEVGNDIKNFKKDGGTDDQLKQLTGIDLSKGGGIILE